MPRTCLPYMFFCLMTPNRLHTVSSASEMRGKGSSYLALKFSCDFSESREIPMTTALAARNSACRSRKSWLSVVQPGVLSLG
ncbi:hypothetical protein D9M68_940900 [compost metagenome]